MKPLTTFHLTLRHRLFIGICIGLFFFGGGNDVLALDVNRNGISDVWDRIYPTAAANLTQDPDGDGYTSRQEGEQGTNPFDASDQFGRTTFTRSVSGDTVNLSWRSLFGRFYGIQESEDLLNWQFRAYAYGAPGVLTTQVIVTNTAARKFFRVVSYPQYDYDADSDERIP